MVNQDNLSHLIKVIERLRGGYNGKEFEANPCPYLPSSAANQVIETAFRKKSSSYLVFFTIEMACVLYARGAKNVVITTTEFCHMTKLLSDQLGYKYMLLVEIEETQMKFDVAVGNPPYQGKAELHQKFFNKAVDLVKDGGVVTFIQPATPYFNKKENIRANAKDMIANVKRYKTEVTILDSAVFDEAQVFTDLAVTTLTKTEFNFGNLESFKSKAGNVMHNISVDAVNMLDMEPVYYTSLVKKIKDKIAINGCLQDLISTDQSTEKFYIQKVRGHIGHVDFYTLISNNSNYWTVKKEHEYGLLLSSTQVDSIVSYLKSFTARFALSIYKFNGNNHMGELRSVPIVPFDRIWNDSLLCEYFGITHDEYLEVLRCIPDYHNLGDNLS